MKRPNHVSAHFDVDPAKPRALNVTFCRESTRPVNFALFPEHLAQRARTLHTAVMALEPLLFSWLQASEDNVRWFALDPLAALKAVVPDVRPELLSELREFADEMARNACAPSEDGRRQGPV